MERDGEQYHFCISMIQKPFSYLHIGIRYPRLYTDLTNTYQIEENQSSIVFITWTYYHQIRNTKTNIEIKASRASAYAFAMIHKKLQNTHNHLPSQIKPQRSITKHIYKSIEHKEINRSYPYTQYKNKSKRRSLSINNRQR